ncbi:hypothetical protein [Streptomyces sp. RLB3-6]|uniref:hypothetical protein n=1 Tax=Streptomyces sp. RLB3-6 TaxID=2594457 RepID=UPI001163E98C|nr:hypothetical protein [Streptomyces sp. RLB3-6]QDN84359.1 hypothetical protein FNV61_00075 [Streptomyces sp. RLB3-6]
MPKSEAEKATEAERIEKAKERLAASKVTRDQRKDDAEFDFWSGVAAAIDSGELKQTEACDAIGYKREYVRRQLIEVRAKAEVRAKDQAPDSTD